MSKQDEHKWHLAGWISFVVGSLLFIADSIRNGNMMALIASVLFLLGCIQFTAPLIYNIYNADEDSSSLLDNNEE